MIALLAFCAALVVLAVGLLGWALLHSGSQREEAEWEALAERIRYQNISNHLGPFVVPPKRGR